MFVETIDLIKNKIDLNNKILCIPTDTVYGIACLYDDIKAKNRIFEIKKRDQLKKIPILISSIDQINLFKCFINEKVLYLMNKHWPGALTIILKNDIDSFAFRMPKCQILLDFINIYGPLAATSANYSGEKEINDIKKINEIFGDKIDYYITNKVRFTSISSTVVDMTTDELKILRQGEIKI